MNLFHFLYNFKKVLAFFLSFFSFPLTCISCGKQCYGIVLCNECIDDFLTEYANYTERCSVCGVPLLSEQEKCLDCRPENITNSTSFQNKAAFLKDIDRIYPVYHYCLWKKELLFAWKIANNRSLTPIISNLFYTIINEQFPAIPVVPVPPRAGKIKQKGWDQIDELCNCLHFIYGITVLKILKRLSHDEQKKRNRKQRIESLEKDYVLDISKKYLPEEVIIVDDIMTTGATLESCAKALKEGGVKKVYAITLFYV